ncbi:MAG TPA: ferritin family protein [Selenomonadales bacterium]|nr:ferritin family protein [Selenomonadales bacterium]
MDQDHPQLLPDPYPAPKVLGENDCYAKLLLHDYAGISGELTAISQYIYHYLTLYCSHPEVARTARMIAINEMHHLELLGKTIQLLGTPPVICCANRQGVQFWDARFVYYGNDLYDQLTANMKQEMDALRNYRNHQRDIHDPFIRELLDRIILDEEHHLRLFSQYRDELCRKAY